MKTLKIYLNLFLISILLLPCVLYSEVNTKTPQGKLILLSDLTESSEQYGFYQLELRLVSTFNTTQNYLLKIYNLPNKNLMLADGDIIYKGKINALADKQFIIYVKPIKAGSNSILFKIKTDNKIYQFKSNYKVTNIKTFDEEKKIDLEKLSLKISSPIAITTINKEENKELDITTQSTLQNSNIKTIILKHKSTRNKIIKIILAIISFFIIIGMLYYKKRTRFFK